MRGVGRGIDRPGPGPGQRGPPEGAAGRDRGITTRWGVTSFPPIFVLDRQGVIRFKNVRSDDLDRAVITLLDETAGLQN